MEDDALLIDKYREGDTNAFGSIYTKYALDIYRFIYFKTFSKEISEDITSEVFMKALQNVHSYSKKRGAFSSWLYRIARNAVIDYYRTRKTNISIDDVFDLPSDLRTEEEAEKMLSLKQVKYYMEKLTPRQREIITMRIWEERPYKEIAHLLGGTEASIKMAFSRTIQEIREKAGPFAILLIIAFRHEVLLSHTFS